MELVTGFAGQAHVDPIDMAHVNAVAFGHDAYLLDTQNKLEPTLETANKLVVDTGDLMIQGHHFTVVQSEEIALQSGVSGQKRNALVCARYEKAEGTGVESASWVVKYGTSTTDTPTDPAVTSGNILDGVDSVHEEPIFRIEYDGITPGDPILLVPEFQSNAKFRDSISQHSETETFTGKYWIDGKPIYRKVIKFGAMTGNNRYTIAHGVSYDTIVSFNAIARNSTNSYLPLARVGYNSDNQIDASLNGYAYITPDDVIIIGGSQTNYTGAHVVIEYTKA